MSLHLQGIHIMDTIEFIGGFDIAFGKPCG